MDKTFEAGRSEIADLVKHFTTNRERYLAPDKKEAEIRDALINPLFEALGWDVSNRKRIAPQYREVVPEPSLDDEGDNAAPDYAFRVGEEPKFYVEAKKCTVKIGREPEEADQE